MLTKRALDLYASLCERPFTPTSLADLKRRTGETSYNTLTSAAEQWREEGLVKTVEAGRNKLYTPNLEREEALTQLCLANLGRLPAKAREAIRTLQRSLEEKNVVWYTLILFGSHADDTATEESDLDLYVLTPTRHDKAAEAASHAQLHTRTTLDVHHDTTEDFARMLDDDKPNLAKAIAHNHKALSNPRPFYEALRESAYADDLNDLQGTGA